jgi:vacuolar iron transporter family protein
VRLSFLLPLLSIVPLCNFSSVSIFFSSELDSPSILGGYGKAIIFGGVDGILTSFTLITGAIGLSNPSLALLLNDFSSLGGGFNWDIILLIGLSNVIAAAVAMGANEYLSSKAHRDFVATEKRREKWEYKNHKDAEIKEMVYLFVQRGMSHPDAELVVKKMAEYEDFFVDLIVSQELGQLSADDSELNFIQDGFIMFISFASFGILPLIPFVLGGYDLLPEKSLAMISVCSTLSLLFFLGCIKSTFR